MTDYTLVCHPDFPSTAITGITVTTGRERGLLTLTYRLAGDLDQVTWPEPAGHARADELWKHTCFEAFIQPAGGPSYTEFNLSPSGRWATYQFDGHRTGMRNGTAAPSLSWSHHVMTASVHLDDLAHDDWRLGLTVVIEAIDGSRSLWALKHNPGPPDFHDADCFIARLPAPNGT